MSVKVLYTTHAIATGGRNGHTRSADGVVDVDLSIPKAMGGPGRAGATTPEDLFAAGYAACFCSAAEFVARQIEAAADVNRDQGQRRHRPARRGRLRAGREPRGDGRRARAGDAEKLIAAAHQVCPYSNATRGNLDVGLEVRTV